jgi:hypothetical protein
MPYRFFELAVRARRLVTRTTDPSRAPRGPRLTARRQLGTELTQFSFRLAFMIDLAYVGLGALGGAAVGRATSADVPPPILPRPPVPTRSYRPARWASPDSMTVSRACPFRHLALLPA